MLVLRCARGKFTSFIQLNDSSSFASVLRVSGEACFRFKSVNVRFVRIFFKPDFLKYGDEYTNRWEGCRFLALHPASERMVETDFLVHFPHVGSRVTSMSNHCIDFGDQLTNAIQYWSVRVCRSVETDFSACGGNVLAAAVKRRPRRRGTPGCRIA